MPNWCNNILTVRGNPEEVARLVEQAKGPDQYYARQGWEDEDFDPKQHAEESPSVFSFHQLVPLPDSVIGGDYDPAGYNAEHEYWGVKWGASHPELVRNEGHYVDYRFSTPWAPPVEFMLRVSKKFPGLIFALSFVEEMPTSGRVAVKDGEVLEDCALPINEWYEQAEKDAKLPEPDGDEETDWEQFQENLEQLLEDNVWGAHYEWVVELEAKHGDN
jgi:hypothetical protein